MTFEMIAGARVALGRGAAAVQLPILVHIAAGVLGIVTGFVALAAAKGARTHRASGVMFVQAMVVMGLVAAAIAAFEVKVGSVDGGLLTAYLVVTGLTTVRPRTVASRRIEVGGMLLALAIGVTNVALGLASALASARTSDDVPVPMYFIFGAIALAAALGDGRALRNGGLRGAPRLARHLWRMCFALFIAAGSFFLGQAHLIPKPFRIYAVLAIPALAPLVAMLYWLSRIRVRRSLRAMVIRVGAAEPA